ncbi:MAG: glycosyltransferase family 4 protein [Magnetococcales bacterium]|nr:glycosyltransferase family 4 protein [Magnetococcales bacterium]
MNNTLHILHTESSLGWGGQEIRILTESLAMLASGHRVTLVCPPEATLFAVARQRGLPVIPLPIARKNLTGLRAMRGFLRANPDTDVIITHSSTDCWLTAVASLLIRRPPPMVRLRHISAPVPVNLPTRWLYATASRLVITTGQGIRDRLIEVNGLQPDRVLSIPTGIDLERFSPGDRDTARARLNLPTDRPIIGIVATLRSWKGHLQLLEAFAALRHPTAILAIVGDGPQQEVLARRAAQLSIPQHQFLMPGRQEDIPAWLRAMDIFVLPSYANEGVPQALMQAMACGLPVISTPVGGIPEMVLHDQTGLLTPPKDPEALRAAMAALLDDPQRCQRLAARALTHARERCSTAIMLEQMERALRRVIEENGQRFPG